MKKHFSTVAIAALFAAAIALCSSALAQQTEVKAAEPVQAEKSVNFDGTWIAPKRTKDFVTELDIFISGDSVYVQNWATGCFNGKSDAKILSKVGDTIELSILYSKKVASCADTTFFLKHQVVNGKASLVNTSNAMRVFYKE